MKEGEVTISLVSPPATHFGAVSDLGGRTLRRVLKNMKEHRDPTYPKHSVGLPDMPISWGDFEGQWGGIYMAVPDRSCLGIKAYQSGHRGRWLHENTGALVSSVSVFSQTPLQERSKPKPHEDLLPMDLAGLEAHRAALGDSSIG